MNNLTNIVKSPTRISNQSSSLIDVMIINNTENETFTVNQNLGYSDHLAQLLYIKTKNPIEGPIYRHKRLFAEKNIEEFQYSLHKENWNEVTSSDEPNTSFNIFMDTFRYYFNTAFPLTHYRRLTRKCVIAHPCVDGSRISAFSCTTSNARFQASLTHWSLQGYRQLHAGCLDLKLQADTPLLNPILER